MRTLFVILVGRCWFSRSDLFVLRVILIAFFDDVQGINFKKYLSSPV